MPQTIRKKKKREHIYLLKPLSVPQLADNPFDSDLITGEGFVVEGKLDEHVIVSVPEVISEGRAGELFQMLRDATEKPVIMVTHNVQFLSTRELTPKEIASLRKKEANGQAVKNTEDSDEEGR